MKRSPLFSLAAVASLLSASPAFAHASLVTSDPKANATVHAGVKVITLTFNERLVPAFSKFKLTMPAHHLVVPVKTVVSKDGKRMVGNLPGRLTTGTYQLAWTAAAADDGHKTAGQLGFKVG